MDDLPFWNRSYDIKIEEKVYRLAILSTAEPEKMLITITGNGLNIAMDIEFFTDEELGLTKDTAKNILESFGATRIPIEEKNPNSKSSK